MDAITLLRNDHKTVEQLFKRFEKAGDRAYVQKREIVDRIIEELSVHAAIEELVFYPVARATVPGTEDIALESLEEHHIVKWLLSELADLDPSDERFDAKVTVLMENVRHHVEEEQSDFFPKVRRELSRTELADLGQALADAKKSAPTHPHPRSPDVPPANAVVGAIAGVVDRVGDNISGIAQGGVTAVQDLIARILGNDKPKVSPTGTTAARTQAKNVRNGASAATDGVETNGAQREVRRQEDHARQRCRAPRERRPRRRSRPPPRRRPPSGPRRRLATPREAATRRTATTAKRAASRTAKSATGSK